MGTRGFPSTNMVYGCRFCLRTISEPIDTFDAREPYPRKPEHA